MCDCDFEGNEICFHCSHLPKHESFWEIIWEQSKGMFWSTDKICFVITDHTGKA